ncbi:MAG: tyrosine-type recombinase/integrase family protein, partial [Lachnospiraceae bacterium]|nr:tyrosine-type recombinase/integrase family protein [Lachnospiraceae bacterium]
MASITKRGDSYLIRVSNGTDHKNNPIIVSMTYKPKAKAESAIRKEIEAAALRFEDKVKNGEYYSGANVFFMDFAKTWFDKWSVKKVTLSTQETYWNLLETWIFPVIGKKKLSKITAFDIQDIIERMESQDRAPGTIRRAISAANSVLKYAYRMNVIRENVIDRVELPKMNHDEDLHYFTLEQSKTFLKALEMEYPFQYAACVQRKLAPRGKEIDHELHESFQLRLH